MAKLQIQGTDQWLQGVKDEKGVCDYKGATPGILDVMEQFHIFFCYGETNPGHSSESTETNLVLHLDGWQQLYESTHDEKITQNYTRAQ